LLPITLLTDVINHCLRISCEPHTCTRRARHESGSPYTTTFRTQPIHGAAHDGKGNTRPTETGPASLVRRLFPSGSGLCSLGGSVTSPWSTSPGSPWGPASGSKTSNQIENQRPSDETFETVLPLDTGALRGDSRCCSSSCLVFRIWGSCFIFASAIRPDHHDGWTLLRGVLSPCRPRSADDALRWCDGAMVRRCDGATVRWRGRGSRWLSGGGCCWAVIIACERSVSA
jgi:hypothetical protein